MALYRRGRVWWCRFTAPDGSQVRRSTRTRVRKEAQEYEDKLRADLWRTQQLGERPRRTWVEAVERYIEEQGGLNPRHKADLRFAHDYLGHLYLDQITRDVIDEIKYARLKSKSARGSNRKIDRNPDDIPTVSPDTVNRLLEFLRAVLRRCEGEWRWLDRAPKIRLLPSSDTRVRWLTREEADRLVRECPPHLAAMVQFSLQTGLRQSNVTGLKWDQVDMERRVAWVPAPQAKGRKGKRKAIGVPLNREAVRILESQSGVSEFVFTYKGQPIANPRTSFHTALRRARIENFRWHDLRHTWASWHVQNGTPLHVLQQLGGWSDIRMVQKYAHLAPEHLAEWAESVAQNPSQKNVAENQRSESD